MVGLVNYMIRVKRESQPFCGPDVITPSVCQSVRTWFTQSLFSLGYSHPHHSPSPAVHLLLSPTGTWPRRTWRTPPSGWERASAPPSAPCWASPCTERFSNSGDGAAAATPPPPTSSLCGLCPSPLTWKTRKPWMSPPPRSCPLFQFHPYNTKKMLRETILYASKHQYLGSFMWGRGWF